MRVFFKAVAFLFMLCGIIALSVLTGALFNPRIRTEVGAFGEAVITELSEAAKKSGVNEYFTGGEGQ